MGEKPVSGKTEEEIPLSLRAVVKAFFCLKVTVPSLRQRLGSSVFQESRRVKK